MGPLEREMALGETTWTGISRKADEIIAKLEARVAALEDALTSQESRRQDPNADREIKWAIVRKRGVNTHIFDREDGFCPVICKADLADGYVALFQTREDAIDVIDALGLEDLDNIGSDGATVRTVRIYTDRMEFVGD